MHAATIYIPWVGSVIAELLIVGMMIREGLQRRFPYFLGAIAYDALRQIVVAFIFFAFPNAHYYAYWASIPVEYLLSFAVIYEVFRHAFEPNIKFSPGTIARFTILVVAVAGFAVALLLKNPTVFTGQLAPLILVLDRSAEIIRCGMLLLLVAFAAKLKITWKHYTFGIAFGLGLYSAAGLITAAVDVATNRMCSSWLTPIPHFAYLAATILWAVYFLRKEPALDPLTPERLEFMKDLLALARAAEHEIRRALNDDR